MGLEALMGWIYTMVDRIQLWQFYKGIQMEKVSWQRMGENEEEEYY